jgi:hypothetical protein
MFGVMSAAGGVGDDHPGQWLQFWRQACEDGRPYACPYAADLSLNFCRQGSGWACNEAGLLHVALAESGEDLRRAERAEAAAPFRSGCDLGVAAACLNRDAAETGLRGFARATPALEDYPIILRGSKGEIRERSPDALYALACRQGWTEACLYSSRLIPLRKP